jgi:ribosomal protein S18 acetylase RimI-like enzyme
MRATVQRPGPATVRRATLEDARGIAEVHARTWRQAYRGLVSQAPAAQPTVDSREDFWRKEMLATTPDRRPWVAETDDGAVGFVSSGISRDADATPAVGEVYAIHVDPGHWRMGIGRVLLEHACRDLREHGFHVATLWIPTANESARRFHEALGWRPDGATRRVTLGRTEFEELRYQRPL